MNRSKQSTLFQSWGSKSQTQSDNRTGSHTHSGTTTSFQGDTIDLCDEDEDEDLQLARALEESLAQYQNECKNKERDVHSNSVSPKPVEKQGEDNVGNISFGIDDHNVLDCGVATDAESHCLSQWKSSDVPAGDLPGFDSSAGRLWIYPTNYPVREYQFNIVKQALVKNTLVTLPTGLGKTFIASVVMYNFYRWYPEGKVVFMAPTKPLVAQQIEACYNIMGIPRNDTAEMTGTMNPTDRQKSWRGRRVFFLTPQVLTNDLSRGTCAAEAVKCLVVDEAHKALGNHAYCQVVRELVKYTRQFRVLALSATPGSDIKAVQQVISNLLISHIELRSEESADIKPYTHERTVDKIVVPLGDELNNLKTKYIQVVSVVVRRLIHQRVLYNREPTSLSKFLILKARDAFRQNPPENLPRSQYGVVEGDFALAMSLYHGYELLQLHGLRSLFNYLQGIISGDKSYGRTRSELMRNADFCDIMDILRDKFQPSVESTSRRSFTVGHPKMVKLEEVVVNHFKKFQAEGSATRVMIFSQYRDSVQEITQMLQQHEPLVKVMSFIGQSSAGKATKGFTQKEQLKVMAAFRNGGYNTLVSTCVGEEGLDIGDVDLIVCFDAHKSPIRLVQRMGRTGRKRQGRIVMLVTEGKEEQIYNHSQYTKRSIHKTILNGAKSLVFYTNNPRMIPADFTPACHRMHITVQQPLEKGKGQGKGRKSQGKLSSLFSKAKSGDGKKSNQDNAGISLEEFAELKSSGAAVITKRLPAPKMVTLQSPADENLDGTEREGELNLSDWLPWQNSLQHTSQFGHSRRSQHLVELLEFTDLQQMLPTGEDNYGQEMRMYLNMEDVTSDSSRPVSEDITQFCVSAEEQAGAADNDEYVAVGPQPAKGNKPTKAKGKRKRTILPVIELEEESDSDTLPDAGFAQPSTSAVQRLSPRAATGAGSHLATGVLSPPHRKEKRRKTRRTERPSLLAPALASVVNDDFDDFESCSATRHDSKAVEEESVSKPAQEAEQSPVHSAVEGIQGACDVGEEVGDVTPMDIQDKEDVNGEETVQGRRVSDMLHVPSPPCLGEISTLLDAISKPDDLLAVDLHCLLKNSTFTQSDSKRSLTSQTSHPYIMPVENIMDKGPQAGDACADLHEDVLAAKMDEKRPADVDHSAPLLEHSFSDSLDESEFDAISEKLLQSYQASHKQRTADSHMLNKASKSSEPGKRDSVVQKPSGVVLSQTEPKSKKQLFRDNGDSAVEQADTGKVKLTVPTRNGVVKRQKSSFVYRMDESSTSCTSTKENEFSSSVQGRTEREKVAETCDENVVWSPGPLTAEAGDNQHTKNTIIPVTTSTTSTTSTTRSNNWITGKQLYQSAAHEAAPNPQRESHIEDMPISDSFFDKHFLDDGGDGDFADDSPRPEQTLFKPAPVESGQRRVSAGRPLKVTLHSPEHVDGGLSTVDMAYTPALFSPEIIQERSPVPARSPLPGAEHSIRGDSMLTFTQALDCVNSHSHSNSSHIDFKEGHSDSKEIRVCPQLSHAQSKTDKSGGQVPNSRPANLDMNAMLRPQSSVPPRHTDGEKIGKEIEAVQARPLELEESPNFDLGFDFDEDIIPPSPEAEQSVSQPVVRSQLSARPALSKPAAETFTSAKTSALNGIPEDFDFEDDDILVGGVDENVDEHSPCFSSSLQGKGSFTTAAHKANASSLNGVEIHEDDFAFDLDFEPQGPESRCSADGTARLTTGAPQSSQGFTCQKQKDIADEEFSPVFTQTKFPGKSDGPATHNIVNERTSGFTDSDKGVSKPSKKPQLRLSTIGAEPEKSPHNDNLGNFSPSFVLLHDFDDEMEPEFAVTDTLKTPAQQKSVESVYCSTPLSSKKPARFTFQDKMDDTPVAPRQKHAVNLVLEEDDGSDFEESIIGRKKLKGSRMRLSESEDDDICGAKVKFKVPCKQAKQKGEKEAMKKKKKKSKRGCAFLDEEAELSGDVDVSSDEADDNLDMMESSFIDNASQLSQHTDMQAVYMKSVQSPVHRRHAQGARFRLQYNHADMNVFSQLPRPEEDESQYQEDSFCVGSDEDEDEDSYETGSEDDDFDLTELKRQRPSSVKRRKKQTVKQVKGRKRVRQIADSSSNDDEDLNRLPPSQITPASRRAAAVRALLSSSEDNLDTSAHEKSPVLHVITEQSNSTASNGKSDPNCQDRASQGFKCTLPSGSASDIVSISATASTCSDRYERKSSEQMPASEPRNSCNLVGEDGNSGRPTGSRSTLLGEESRGERMSKFQKPTQVIMPTRSATSVQPVLHTSDELSHRYSPQNVEHSKAVKFAGTEKETSASTVSSTPVADVRKASSAGSSSSLTVGAIDSSSNVPAGTSSIQTLPDTSDPVKFTSIADHERGKAVILVDSREISGAQDIVSALRLQYNAHVYTRQLTVCDYVLSNRMAVERLSWSGFSASTNRNKLCERLQQMQALYDRCVVIVEKDRVKPGEEKSARPQQHSKYIDMIIAQLAQTSVRTFFTENQSETAKLLAELCSSERRKGMAITAPVNLSEEKEQVVKFYMSIPMVNITRALNLCFNFNSMNDFLQSPVTEIQKKGHMSFGRAHEIYNFIHHRFSQVLMSNS